MERHLRRPFEAKRDAATLRSPIWRRSMA